MAGKRKEKTITCNYSKFIEEFIIVGPIVYQMCMTYYDVKRRVLYM